jgi:hypothetical protein
MQIEESHQNDDPAKMETDDPAPEIDAQSETDTRPETAPRLGDRSPKLETSSLEAEFETLHRLKEKGLITDAEWTQKKRKLLGL